MLVDFFSLRVMAEVLRANIDWKSAFLEEMGQFQPNSHIEGDVPNQPFFARIDRPMNALQLYR